MMVSCFLFVIGILTVVRSHFVDPVPLDYSAKNIAIILVEQYLDFARELGDRFVVMDRGSIIYSAHRDAIDEAALRKAMAL